MFNHKIIKYQLRLLLQTTIILSAIMLLSPYAVFAAMHLSTKEVRQDYPPVVQATPSQQTAPNGKEELLIEEVIKEEPPPIPPNIRLSTASKVVLAGAATIGIVWGAQKESSSSNTPRKKKNPKRE